MPDVEKSRTVQYNQYGTAEVLRVNLLPAPEAGPGQIRVRVRAAGLNPFDSKVRSGVGSYRSDAPFPRGVGLDFAGVVDTVQGHLFLADGAPVAVGDEVIGWTNQCSMSDYVVVGPMEVVRKPGAMAWDVAGAIQTPARTAQNCLSLLDIGSQDVVLLGAAAGGVGSLLSQLAISRGARVIGTASTRNSEFLRALNVLPIEYGPGLVERVRAVGWQVTAAIDCHGRDVVDAALALGLPPGRIATLVRHDVTQELGLVSLGPPKSSPAILHAVVDTVVDRGLQIPVQSFPLEEVARAYALLDGGHVRGKLVVRTD